MKKQKQERSTNSANKFIIELSIGGEDDTMFDVDVNITAANISEAATGAQRTLWLAGAGMVDFLMNEHQKAVDRGAAVLAEMYSGAKRETKKPRKAKKNG